MKICLFKKMRTIFNLFFTLLLVALMSSCEKEAANEEFENDYNAVNLVGKANTANGFMAFHQGFNHSVHPWVDLSVEGVLGWCGTIELQNRKSGEVSPSAGNGYATVMWGECNEFWQADPSEIPFKEEAGLPAFPEGAPATQDPALWSSSWPSSGFVQDLDIYLDPEMFSEGVAFIYSESIKALEGMSFTYFGVNVMKTGGELYINDFMIPEEGWYTFSFVNGDNDGRLTLDFELFKNNKMLYSVPLETSLFDPDLATSEIEVKDYGSGYIWFALLQEGVALPIDEQMLRPGK